MPTTSTDYLTQLDNLLTCSRQSWLFGAGISIGGNIPLMGPLTDRVTAVLSGTAAETLLLAIRDELPATAHIEHILSQIGDYAAIAERTKNDALINGSAFPLTDLTLHHEAILRAIAETIRWGYKKANGGTPELIGSYSSPLVRIDDHGRFVRALLGKSQAGIADRRHPAKLFTTNYDTLLEDALSLEAFTYWDGFSGGAVAFRSHRYGNPDFTDPVRAHVIKLHGSIDWHLSNDGKIWRVRDSDLYPERTGRVLIYPQSTKYLATQRDPFAAQFDLLRRSLADRSENLFAVCGYSFGDDHINQEIELAMQSPDNKTTMIAFASGLNETLTRWQNDHWNKRLYIVTESGLCVGKEGPFHVPSAGHTHDWWTFAGVIKILTEGAETAVV